MYQTLGYTKTKIGTCPSKSIVPRRSKPSITLAFARTQTRRKCYVITSEPYNAENPPVYGVSPIINTCIQ